MITKTLFRWPHRVGRLLRGSPRVIAAFSFRYDAHLVPDLIENLRPIVDGYAAFDDRAATELFTNEPRRRALLIQAVREMRGSWVLFIDPDERLERPARDRIPDLVRVHEPMVWGFRLRELYAPDAYRVDGYWGEKRVYRLFPLIDGQALGTEALHGSHHPVGYPRKRTDINLYHLKMIDPARRVARRDLYTALDPDSAFQARGYDYLADDRGIALEHIPRGREFQPKHDDDGGLWMADVRKADAGAGASGKPPSAGRA